MRKITRISVHCSDTVSGNLESFRRYHVDTLGWSDVGYHYIILNGREHGRKYNFMRDGAVESGRPITKTPASVKGFNTGMIAICLVGKKRFTFKQFRTLTRHLRILIKLYKVKPENIHGHCHWNRHKTCPNFDVDKFVRLMYNKSST